MADQTTRIDVRCEQSVRGWRCRVTVGEDPAATTHEVEVTADDLSRLAPAAAVEQLVVASFEFLLEREPREAILRSFDLPVIQRYFPEYAAEINGRL